MGSVPTSLARELAASLDLGRAVETGTYWGQGARALAGVFPSVITIELSPELADRAASSLADLPNVSVLTGSSADLLGPLANDEVPTLYWLDGHWSGGETAGRENECPVLAEVARIGAGHPSDCYLIDDARLFTAAPPPPHRSEQWPTLWQVLTALHAERPTHHLTVLADLIIAVPQRAKPLVDQFGRDQTGSSSEQPHHRSTLRRAVSRLTG